MYRSRVAQEPTSSPPRPARELTLILLLALGVRILRILYFTDVVEIEGSEYGRIAQNLARDGSYVGLIEGPELMLPPLYPFAIAAVAPLTGDDVVLAGRVVSCLASMVTVLACWLLALRTAGVRAARWTGLLVAVVPGCVLTGTAVFSEGLLMAWLALGLLAFERTVTTRGVLPAIGCGAAFGLAYLTRIESVLIAPVAVLLLALGWPRGGAPLKTRWPSAVACAVVFVAVAVPYPLWVKDVTGKSTFAGKAARVFVTIERFSRDMSLDAASYALADDGTPEGPWLTPNQPWDGPTPMEIVSASPAPILLYVLDNARRAAIILLTGKGILSVLWLFAFWFAWRYRRKNATRLRGSAATDLLLLWMFAYVIGMACVYKVLIRYLVPLAIPAAIWAGRGIAGFDRSYGKGWLLIALLVLSSSRGFLTGHGEFDETATDPNAAVHEIADALRTHATEDTIVLADDSRVPFHAGTWWRPTPLTDEDTLLTAYAKSTGATFLVATVTGSHTRRPGPWLDPRMDVPGLTQLARTGNGRYVLYRID